MLSWQYIRLIQRINLRSPAHAVIQNSLAVVMGGHHDRVDVNENLQSALCGG